MEHLEEIVQQRLKGNAFMLHNHMELESVEQERAVFHLEIRPDSRNNYGQVHGGAIYTLADNTAGTAAHTDGRYYVTQTSALHFLRNQSSGMVRAEAHVRHRGKSTCLVAVDITGEGGKLLATGEFTFFCVDKSVMDQKRQEA